MSNLLGSRRRILVAEGFDYPDNTLLTSLAGWTDGAPSAGAQSRILNGQLCNISGDGTQNSIVMATARAWPNDQWAEVTVKKRGTTAESDGGVVVRWSAASGGSGYAVAVFFSGGGTFQLGYQNAGAFTNIVVITATPPLDGDRVRLEIVGTTLRLLRNDSVLYSGVPAFAIASGSPGPFTWCSTGNTANLDAVNEDFMAGDFTPVLRAPLVSLQRF